MGISSKVCLLLCVFVAVCRLCSCDDDSEEKEDAFGGVSIKVFRGPSKWKGKEVFAPFGYYVKMPADSSHGHKGDSEEETRSVEFKTDDSSDDSDDDDDDNKK